MSAAEYFDVFTEFQPVNSNLLEPVYSPVEKPVARERFVNLFLDSVMFTGRVPLSTWTFTIAIADKLWVSDRTSLYFGKEMAIRRFIFQDKHPVVQHRVNLDIGVSAYNNYGDVLQATQCVRFYDAGNGVQPGALLQVEDNWMQLLFKFRLSFDDGQQN